MITATLSSSCNADPGLRPQLEDAIDTPIEAAAGMAVTKMNTPIRASARARDTTPTMPASTATTRKYPSGVSMKSATGRTPSGTGPGPCPIPGQPGRTATSPRWRPGNPTAGRAGHPAPTSAQGAARGSVRGGQRPNQNGTNGSARGSSAPATLGDGARRHGCARVGAVPAGRPGSCCPPSGRPCCRSRPVAERADPAPRRNTRQGGPADECAR